MTVHGLPSSTATGVPAPHVPAPSHTSAPLQLSPSPHVAPCERAKKNAPKYGRQTSIVHGLPSPTGPGHHHNDMSSGASCATAQIAAAGRKKIDIVAITNSASSRAASLARKIFAIPCTPADPRKQTALGHA